MLLGDQLVRCVTVFGIAQTFPEPPVEGLAATEHRVVGRIDDLSRAAAISAVGTEQPVMRAHAGAALASNPCRLVALIERDFGCLHKETIAGTLAEGGPARRLAGIGVIALEPGFQALRFEQFRPPA